MSDQGGTRDSRDGEGLIKVGLTRWRGSDQGLIKVARGTEVEQVVADTDGVDDVDCEERNPAEHEHA